MKFIDVKTITELRNYLLENRDVKSMFFHESPHSEKGIEFVQVVRCKDCKYADWWGPQGKEKFDCDRFIDSPPITPEWYCAWGEKREDENN